MIGHDIGKFIDEAEALAYPPPHLRPRTTRITSLPMLAFAGLIDGAPISYEEASKARDIAAHHSMRHSIEHEFDGNEQKYIESVARKYATEERDTNLLR